MGLDGRSLKACAASGCKRTAGPDGLCSKHRARKKAKTSTRGKAGTWRPTGDQVAEARRLHRALRPASEIAKAIGVDARTVKKILAGGFDE